MKKKKYQVGGDSNQALIEAIQKGIVTVPEEYRSMFQGVLPQQPAPQQPMPFSFIKQPGSVSHQNVSQPKGNVQQLQEQGWSLTPNDKGVMLERNTGNVDFNPYFKDFNLLAQLTTGIANKVSDINNDKKYYSDYRKALAPTQYENFDENGLNQGNIFFQNGGKVLDAGEAAAILNGGKVYGKDLSSRQRKFFTLVKQGKSAEQARKIIDKKYPKKGEKMQMGGDNSNPIEAEAGEMFTDTSGGISKVPDDAKTHEQGGEIVDNAERVLEDTSDKRKDKVSKSLLINPDRAEDLTGYRPKSSKSHSKLLEEATNHYEKQVNRFQTRLKSSVETIQDSPADKLAHNSLDMNLRSMNKIPTSGELFDILFGHQETIKKMNQVAPQTKYAVGGPVDPIDEYRKSKTKAGHTTPTNQSSLYNRGQDYLNSWEAIIPGISKLDNKQAQAAIYDHMLQTDEGKGALSQMWKQYGLTNQGKKYKDLTSLTNKGVFDPNKEIGDEQLASLKKAYVDGMFGARQVLPPDQTQPPINRVPIDPVVPYPTAPQDPQTPQQPQGAPPRKQFNINTQAKSQFYEPLRWFDVAGPISSLLSSDRIPAKYDAPQYNQLRLQQQNPLPELQGAQTDYNTAIQSLDPTTGFGAANTANLFSKKYAMDNQVFGQYNNINNNIKNQEIQYNTQVRDRQSQSDVQARGQFEQKYLLGKEAQRQQQLTSMDELYTRLAQNRRLNREGALVQQLLPAFDQNLNYNGMQAPLHAPLGMGDGQQAGIQYITDPQSGQKYRVMKDANGKLISSSKVLTDNKAVGTKGR